jgi:hypothetical protein
MFLRRFPVIAGLLRVTLRVLFPTRLSHDFEFPKSTSIVAAPLFPDASTLFWTNCHAVLDVLLHCFPVNGIRLSLRIVIHRLGDAGGFFQDGVEYQRGSSQNRVGDRFARTASSTTHSARLG